MIGSDQDAHAREQSACKPGKQGDLLFLVNGGLGDLCHAIPVLLAVGHRHPAMRLHVLVGSEGSRQLTSHALPDSVVVSRSDLAGVSRGFRQIVRWRKTKFALAFSGAHWNSLKTAAIAGLVGGRRTVGLADERFACLYGKTVQAPASQKPAARYRALFSTLELTDADYERGHEEFVACLRRIADSEQPVLSTTGNVTRFALVNGADTVARGRWNPHLKRLPGGTLLRLFRALGEGDKAQFVLLGTKGDVFPDALANNRGVIDMRGRTTIRQLISVLGKVDLVVSNDTGTLHLASYCGTPCVGLFGPTRKARYAPTSADEYCVQAPGPCSGCYPNPTCGLRECRLLAELTLDPVLSAVRRALNEHDLVGERSGSLGVISDPSVLP